MFLKTILVLLFLMMLQSLGYTGLKKCSSSSPCTRLRDCPEMLKFVQSRVSADRLLVMKNICGFIGKKSMVCCQIRTSTVSTASRAALLPSNCGIGLEIKNIITHSGGDEEAFLNAYPWMVAMAYEEIGLPGIRILCSGSLISERYVLTAAHCVDRNLLGAKRLKKLHVGDWNLNTDKNCEITGIGTICSPRVTFGAEEVTIHPDYNTRAESSDDIALIRLDRSVKFSHAIQPICLPPKSFNLKKASRNRVSLAAVIWGRADNSTQNDMLLRIFLIFNDKQICRNVYGNRFVNKQLCVGGERGIDTCSGDSGGPLIIPGPKGPPFLQIGIVSFGSRPCGIQDRPGVYTSVSSYRQWIQDHLEP